VNARLARAQARPDDDAMAVRSSTPETPGGTQILVVDDERDIREALAELLDDAGFTVATAEDGARALEWMRSHPGSPGVVLLDMMMPVMDGFSFLAHRERDPALRAVRVVAFTANELAGKEALDSERVEAVLHKPLAWRRMMALLQDRLGLAPIDRQRQAR
jgi:CheY-like chemotaxis protein